MLLALLTLLLPGLATSPLQPLPLHPVLQDDTSGDAVPVPSRMRPISLRLSGTLDGHRVTAQVSPGVGETFIFPSFAILSAEYSLNGQAVPLIDKSGSITVPALPADANKVQVDVQLLHLQGDPELHQEFSEAIVAALSRDDSLPDKTNLPKIGSTWTANLFVPEYERSGIPVAVSPHWVLPLQLNQSVYDLRFFIDARGLELLKGKPASELTLQLSNTFDARITQEDFDVLLTAASSALAETVNRLRSSRAAGSEQPEFIIPVGGDGSLQGGLGINGSIGAAMRLQVWRRVGGRESEVLFVNNMLSTLLADLLSQAKEISVQEDASKAVAFLLSDSLSFSTPLGEINTLVQRLKDEREQNVNKLRDDYYRAEEGDKLRASFDPSTYEGSLEFEGGDETKVALRRAESNYDRFLKEVENIAGGRITTVSALHIQQTGEYAWSESFGARIQVGSFIRGDAVVNVRLSMSASTDFRRTTAPYVPLGSVLDWYGFDQGAIPRGFQVCDGSRVTDEESPFFGQETPNLIDTFVMGVALDKRGVPGGANRVSLSHTHPFSASGNTGGNGDAHGWTRLTGGDIMVSHNTRNHSHSFSVSGTTGASSVSSFDNRPKYLGLVKIIRIK